MSWQEAELRKRREQRVVEDEKRKKANIRAQRIAEFWRNIVARNNALPTELRMPIEKDQFGTQLLVGTRGADLELKYGKIAYRKIKSVCGVGTMCEEYIMRYNGDKNILFFQHISARTTMPTVPITEESIPIIIQNLCTGRYIIAGLVHDVVRIPGETLEETKKRWKSIGIF